MRARTRAGLLTRLERLECRVAASDHTVKLRFGHLKRLPREYQGERHSIVARVLPKQSDQELVEFEEVPGPDPDPPEQLARGIPQRIDVMFVGPYPRTEEDLEALGDQPAQASSSGNPGMCRALVRAHHRLHGTLGAANPRFIQREVVRKRKP